MSFRLWATAEPRANVWFLNMSQIGVYSLFDFDPQWTAQNRPDVDRSNPARLVARTGVT